MLKDLIETLAKGLVDDTEAVKVNEVSGGQSVIIELRVAKMDTGKVIGRQGRTAEALRTILNAAAMKDGKRSVLEILE